MISRVLLSVFLKVRNNHSVPRVLRKLDLCTVLNVSFGQGISRNGEKSRRKPRIGLAQRPTSQPHLLRILQPCRPVAAAVEVGLMGNVVDEVAEQTEAEGQVAGLEAVPT